MELGNQIREHRKALHLTQDALAEKIMVTRQTVSNWENGKNYPDLQSLLLLSELFHITLDQLVKGDIEIMKEKINQEDIRKFERDSNLFSILLIAVIASAIPLVNAFGLAGAAVWIILAAAMLYFGFRVEKTKKENDIHTYKEILAFMNGKKLEGIEKAREEGKRNYQRILLAIASAAAAVMVSLLLSILLKQ